MSRLKAGLDKLYASKAGLSDSYKKDPDGAWRASGVKATGLVKPEIDGRSIQLTERFKKDAERLAIDLKLKLDSGVVFDFNAVFHEGMEKLSKEYELKMEAIKKLEEMDDFPTITMKLNQPYKLTVQFADGTYRTRPFIGGEEFVAVGRKVGLRGQEIVVAEPVGDAIEPDSKHGKIERMEIDMAKVGTVFDTTMPVERGLAAQKAKEAIAERRKKAAEEARLKKEADEARMSQHELIGSW